MLRSVSRFKRFAPADFSGLSRFVRKESWYFYHAGLTVMLVNTLLERSDPEVQNTREILFLLISVSSF